MSFTSSEVISARVELRWIRILQDLQSSRRVSDPWTPIACANTKKMICVLPKGRFVNIVPATLCQNVPLMSQYKATNKTAIQS